MILLGDELDDRFSELLREHASVGIATAWATCGAHLEALAAAERRGVKVRAIVGIAGNATHPDALDELNRITRGDLRIVPKGNRLFHPKLYLFGRRDGTVTRGWIGSANFTRAGFGGHSRPNEEIMLEVGPGARADELAAQFREWWKPLDTDTPEVIRRYTREWQPPHREVRTVVSGPVTRRVELLLEHHPLTFEQFHRALRECDEMLRDREWEVFHPERESYLAAIRGRQALLLGEARWRDLEPESQQKLKGSYRSAGLTWWGLLGRMNRGGTWEAVCDRQTEIQRILRRVRHERDDEAFPEIAVDAMKALRAKWVKRGTTTLLLTLARPDRLLSLNWRSEKGLGDLSGIHASDLRKPEGYGRLLRWLYKQPWYAGGPPADEELLPIWHCRAALLDAFVYDDK